jgi:hypothetical protein
MGVKVLGVIGIMAAGTMAFTPSETGRGLAPQSAETRGSALDNERGTMSPQVRLVAQARRRQKEGASRTRVTKMQRKNPRVSRGSGPPRSSKREMKKALKAQGPQSVFLRLYLLKQMGRRR